MLTLHYLPGTCAFVPHVALEWSKLPYQAQAESRDSIKTPAYLAKHPLGQVPLLTDGDWSLCQNLAIIDYVNRLAPQSGIFGHGDARQKVKALQWLAFANNTLHPRFGFIFAPMRFLDGEAEQQKLAEKARRDVVKLYAVIDDALDGQDYLAGELSIADVYVYITLRWAQKLNIDLSSLPRLAAYRARVESNAGVRRVLQVHGLS